MSRLLHLNWSRDSAGYEIVELEEPDAGFDLGKELTQSGGKTQPLEAVDHLRLVSKVEMAAEGFGFGPPLPSDAEAKICIRGNGGPPISYQPLEREPALFKILSETELTPEGACSFANQFGLLSVFSKGLSPWLLWWDRINTIRKLVSIWEEHEKEPPKRVLDYINISKFFDSHDFGDLILRMHYIPDTSNNEPPELRIEPRTLWGGLLLQFAQAVTSNAMLRKCDYCSRWFSVGPGTGRRNTAKFCADRCRVASHRKKGSRAS